MSKLKKAIFYLVSLAVITLLSGCEQEGPVERGGKKIDSTIQDTKKAVKGVGKKKGPMERAGEKIDNTIEDTGKAIKGVSEKKDEKKE